MINDKVDPFINQYRDALERQRDLNYQNIENTRRNDFAGIMSGANTAGMMYSNFPQRTKIQYNTTNYQPNIIKAQNTYRTGLDKLRSNTINLYNQLKSINESISDLNSSKSSSNSTNDFLAALLEKLAGNNGNNNNSNTTKKSWFDRAADSIKDKVQEYLDQQK